MAKLGEFASALGGFLRESWPGSRKAPWGSIKTVWQDIVATAFTTMAVYSAYPQETKDMTVTTASTGVAKHIPALGWLRSYQSDWLRLDMVAGLTAAAVVIPQAMAYAAIAGLPVEVGLYKEISCRRSCRCWKG